MMDENKIPTQRERLAPIATGRWTTMRNYFERRRKDAADKAAYQSLASLSDQVLSDVGMSRAAVIAHGDMPVHLMAQSNFEHARALSRFTGG
jgi:uncharacterized protein YjiS (DUF1127 family)